MLFLMLNVTLMYWNWRPPLCEHQPIWGNTTRNLGILLELSPFLLSLSFFQVNCSPGPIHVINYFLRLVLLLGLMPPLITTPTTSSPKMHSFVVPHQGRIKHQEKPSHSKESKQSVLVQASLSSLLFKITKHLSAMCTVIFELVLKAEIWSLGLSCVFLDLPPSSCRSRQNQLLACYQFTSHQYTLFPAQLGPLLTAHQLFPIIVKM